MLSSFCQNVDKMLKKMSTKGILMHKGKLVSIGKIEDIIEEYYTLSDGDNDE